MIIDTTQIQYSFGKTILAAVCYDKSFNSLPVRKKFIKKLRAKRKDESDIWVTFYVEDWNYYGNKEKVIQFEFFGTNKTDFLQDIEAEGKKMADRITANMYMFEERLERAVRENIKNEKKHNRDIDSSSGTL